MYRFEQTLAFRHLRSGGWQTLLTVSAVAAGVVVVVFICSMMFGMSSYWTDYITDIMPSVTVTPREQIPEPLADARGLTASRIERQGLQIKRIEDWLRVTEGIRRIPGVTEAAPAVFGRGFASRGGRQLGTVVYGAEPARLDRGMPVT